MGIDDQGKKFTLSRDFMLDQLKPPVSNHEKGSKEDIHKHLETISKNLKIIGNNLYSIGLGSKVENNVSKMITKTGDVSQAIKQTVEEYRKNIYNV